VEAIAIASPRISSRLVAIACAGGVLAWLPLLLPTGLPRFVAALAVAIYLMKLWDLAVDEIDGRAVDAQATWRFLRNTFSLVRRAESPEHVPSPRENVTILGSALASLFLSATALLLARTIPWQSVPFLVEHTVKAAGLFIAGVATLHVWASITRSFGGYVIDVGSAPFDAATPAEFWRRYNRPVNQFMWKDVFARFGGRRHPVRGTLLAFAVSGLVHEYILSISVGHLQGLQMTYFMLQGAGVAATIHVRPAGARRLPWQAATLLFNLLTSIIFFMSANEVIPIYVDRLP
jgi:hypothetical protein